MTRYKDIPVVQYLRTNLVSPPAKKQDNDDNRIDTRMQHFLKQGNIPCYGNLSVTELGQIANWLDSYLLQGPKRRHLWLGRACQAHAATLLIAYRTRNMLQDQTDHSQDSEMPDQHILQTAWTIQMRFQSMDTEFIIDVDKECLALFEERLFEVSKHAGPAGDYQWGLDSGDHQDKWDPWGDIPSHWKDPNHDIDAEELEVSASISCLNLENKLYLVCSMDQTSFILHHLSPSPLIEARGLLHVQFNLQEIPRKES